MAVVVDQDMGIIMVKEADKVVEDRGVEEEEAAVAVAAMEVEVDQVMDMVMAKGMVEHKDKVAAVVEEEEEEGRTLGCVSVLRGGGARGRDWL